MIINLIILLVIILLLCTSINYNLTHRCPRYHVKIKYIRASRLPGVTYQERTGIEKINLKLDRDVPCGVYILTTSYGKGALFVPSSSPRFGYLSMKNLDSLDKITMFDLWDLERLESDENMFIQTYNRGCCE